jgi:hypothetical protein
MHRDDMPPVSFIHRADPVQALPSNATHEQRVAHAAALAAFSSISPYMTPLYHPYGIPAVPYGSPGFHPSMPMAPGPPSNGAPYANGVSSGGDNPLEGTAPAATHAVASTAVAGTGTPFVAATPLPPAVPGNASPQTPAASSPPPAAVVVLGVPEPAAASSPAPASADEPSSSFAGVTPSSVPFSGPMTLEERATAAATAAVAASVAAARQMLQGQVAVLQQQMGLLDAVETAALDESRRRGPGTSSAGTTGAAPATGEQLLDPGTQA